MYGVATQSPRLSSRPALWQPQSAIPTKPSGGWRGLAGAFTGKTVFREILPVSLRYNRSCPAVDSSNLDNIRVALGGKFPCSLFTAVAASAINQNQCVFIR